MKGLLLKNRLIVATGFVVVFGFVAFVIFFVLQPSPSSEVPPTPAPVITQTTMQAEADPFMNPKGSVAIKPYGLYTSEVVVQPSECSTPARGITYLMVGDICTVSIDRTMYPYIYGRGLPGNFDITSPLNSESLLVVQLKGSEPFGIFVLEEGFLENTRQLPNDVLTSGVFGFDVEPNSITSSLDSPLADPN